MFTLTALVLVSVLQFSAVMGGVDAVRRKSSSSPSADCLGFSPKASPGVVVAEWTYYPANTTVVISNDYLGFGSASLPAFCRIQLLITTNATAGSFAHTEVWLPDATAWNQRMLTIGGGGISGGGMSGNDIYAFNSGAYRTSSGRRCSEFPGTPRKDVSSLPWSHAARFLSDAFFLQLRACPPMAAITPRHMTEPGADLTTT